MSSEPPKKQKNKNPNNNQKTRHFLDQKVVFPRYLCIKDFI